VTIESRVDGLDHLTEALGKMPAELSKERRSSMSKAMTIMQDEARHRIHSPGGHAAKGIIQRITFSGATVSGKLMPGARPNGLAMIFAQRSTKPGRTPPPVSAITRLAKSLGINPFALARSIGKKGTKGHPIMRESFVAKRAETMAAFKAALEHVVALARHQL
jgi:hypothetical protein